MGYDKLFQKKKLRAEGRLIRREAKKLLYITILIIGEGLTEFNYFNDLRRFFRHKGINIILEVAKGSAPINLVDFAVEYADKNDGVDYVFCVFDRDEHTSYNEAIDKIKNYKSPRVAKSKPEFYAVTSEPCFEIWPLLHYTFTTKGYSRIGNKSAGDNVTSDLVREFPEYSKNMMNLFSRLHHRLSTALLNAEKLLAHNKKIDTTNPSTNMHELINLIIKITERKA